MGWFATQKAPAALEAFRVCDLMDAKMAELHDHLAAAAKVLDAEEYDRVVREFDAAAAEPRRLRAHFDQTADATPVDGKGDHEGTYGLLAEQISAAVQALDPTGAALQRYANAKAETEYRAGQLANDIAHARTLIGALPAAERAMWEQRLSVSQDRLREAAERAGERKWLLALDIVEGAAADVAALIRSVRDIASEHAEETAGLNALTDQLAAVCAAGQATVQLLEEASAVLSEEGTKVARARILAAGQRVAAAQSSLRELRSTTSEPHAVAALAQELAQVGEVVAGLDAELREVIAAAQTDGTNA